MKHAQQPFRLRHMREFGDGTAFYECYDLSPGLTPGDLIEYVLECRQSDVGKIHSSDGDPFMVAEYERGHLTSTFIIPLKPIKRLEIYGGYHVWDYIFTL